MKKLDVPSKVVLFCDGSKCGKENKQNRKIFKSILKEAGLKKEIMIQKMYCTDNCKCAPVIALQPQNLWFGEVSERNVEKIFSEYLIENHHKE
ncbi:(2Fe-2S) ferredoxin domain-containing protein [Flavobacterium sp. NST-5]|uniref:(2Fe-2S) ferredoxin domain-containing protein n=1 Tax=Flavobacterium ichthyis TaxID=2698827 RepID=A0ABW9Z906_9FLAO|nr:(2Fe-2S) ferredoxin domain-containing protein [Flavobacterium ichthyis]NBL65357.1 (2Fe-2S) ferredoxin domain-containing protein [Flavobacterium ichthyis]